MTAAVEPRRRGAAIAESTNARRLVDLVFRLREFGIVAVLALLVFVTAAIEPQFTHYIVTTKDGHVHDGVLARETPALITLRGGTEEGDETILRASIQEIRASSISLMPEELEKSINRQGLADVIAYLRSVPRAVK